MDILLGNSTLAHRDSALGKQHSNHTVETRTYSPMYHRRCIPSAGHQRTQAHSYIHSHQQHRDTVHYHHTDFAHIRQSIVADIPLPDCHNDPADTSTVTCGSLRDTGHSARKLLLADMDFCTFHYHRTCYAHNRYHWRIRTIHTTLWARPGSHLGTNKSHGVQTPYKRHCDRKRYL